MYSESRNMKTKTKTLKPLTSKQAAFVKHLVNNPKDSATEAAAQTYRTSNRMVAKSIATENLSKPAIQTELAKYNDLVENSLINTINDWQSSDKVGERALAMEQARFVHDKIHGKATQRAELHATGITLNIDLTSALMDEE